MTGLKKSVGWFFKNQKEEVHLEKRLDEFENLNQGFKMKKKNKNVVGYHIVDGSDPILVNGLIRLKAPYKFELNSSLSSNLKIYLGIKFDRAILISSFSGLEKQNVELVNDGQVFEENQDPYVILKCSKDIAYFERTSSLATAFPIPLFEIEKNE